MPDLGQDPGNLQNIPLGDDSHQDFNTTVNNTTPSNQEETLSGKYMDSSNNGNNQFGRDFDPFGSSPNSARGLPGDPTFTRQTAPIIGEHIDDDFNDDSFSRDDHSNATNCEYKFSQQSAPKACEKKEETEGNRIGLDPSQDYAQKNDNSTISNSKKPSENLKSEKDPSTANPSKKENRKSIKLDYRQPLRLNCPSVFIYGLERMAVKYLVMSTVFCLYLGQSGYGITALLIANIIGAAAFYMLSSSVLKSLNWQIEKIDGAEILNEKNDGETMEWFNVIIEKIWRCVDPDVFAVVEDILEDTISRVAPKIIKAVKVCDFDLGVESPRIEKINIFPPKSGQPSDSIFGEVEFTLGIDRNNTATVTHKPHTSSTPGFSIRFKTAINTSIDIRGELTKLAGKIRFKIITAPEPPFVSRVTFSFIKAPEIETAVMPITKRLNIMRLPMLKTVVDQGVKLGFKGLVDPKSLSIDIPPIMVGALIDTNAIGVVKVEVKGARNLHSVTGDIQDSFVTFSLSDKPESNIKSTRILSKNANPIWGENLYQLITVEDITKEVFLNISVWEADKLHPDKLWGSIAISAKDVVLATLDKYDIVSSWFTEERLIFNGWAPIDGESEMNSKMQLNFKLSFHPKYLTPVPSARDHAKTKKAQKEKAERKREKKAKKELEKSSIDTNTHYTVRRLDNDTFNEIERPNLENGAVSIISEQASDIDRTVLESCDQEEAHEIDNYITDDEPSDDDEGEPVIPSHTSGILSIKIVKAKDLEIIDPEVIFFKNRRHPYSSNKSVSPYADLYINDNKVFRTRTKMHTSNPNWNAVSECFIKHFETAYIRVSVKNNIDLEENPVIGTSILKISDLFHSKSKKSKESVRWISLSNGIGYGKVLLDLKYKPIKMGLPRELSGADVGTLILDNIQLVDIRSPMHHEKLFSTKATIFLNVEPKITRELNSDLLQQAHNTVGWFRSNLYLPLMMRYRSALCINLSQGSNRKASARLWMKEVYDYDWQEVSLALRGYTDDNDHDELSWGEEGPCGNIVIRLKFVPGFSPVHTELPAFTTDMLGADPFQDNDTRDKAHLLIRQEGTENYSTEPLLKENKEGSSKPEEEISNQKYPQPTILKQIENQESSLINNADVSKSEERRTSGASVTFDTYRSLSTGSTTYLISDKVPSTSINAALQSTYRSSKDTSYKRISSLSGVTLSEDERADINNSTVTTGVVHPDKKLNEVIEIETVGYLNSMQDDLKNSKIKKYKLMRKLTKGKDVLVKKINSLRYGYNSQIRASKAIVEEA